MALRPYFTRLPGGAGASAAPESPHACEGPALASGRARRPASPASRRSSRSSGRCSPVPASRNWHRRSRGDVPGYEQRQITGVYSRHRHTNVGSARFVLNRNRALTLTDGKLLSAPGLSIGGNGRRCVLSSDGSKDDLTDPGHVLTCKASAP